MLRFTSGDEFMVLVVNLLLKVRVLSRFEGRSGCVEVRVSLP